MTLEVLKSFIQSTYISVSLSKVFVYASMLRNWIRCLSRMNLWKESFKWKYTFKEKHRFINLWAFLLGGLMLNVLLSLSHSQDHTPFNQASTWSKSREFDGESWILTNAKKTASTWYAIDMTQTNNGLSTADTRFGNRHCSEKNELHAPWGQGKKLFGLH